MTPGAAERLAGTTHRPFGNGTADRSVPGRGQDLALLHGWNGNGAIETVVLDKPNIRPNGARPGV
jgi:hypothetical protein